MVNTQSKLMWDKSILDPEWQVSAITWKDFSYLLSFLKYGSVERVMLLMLAYTGCRISELSIMETRDLNDLVISWRLGKNQVGRRKESLPESFVQELKFYRANNLTDSTRLFGVSHVTFRTRFNRLRKTVGGIWAEHSEDDLRADKTKKPYLLRLKGFRKTFQTVLFKYYIEKYGDAAVALEFVSRRMKHSSTHMTAYHYIENYEVINVVQWIECFFCEKPRLEYQARLEEYQKSTRELI